MQRHLHPSHPSRPARCRPPSCPRRPCFRRPRRYLFSSCPCTPSVCRYTSQPEPDPFSRPLATYGAVAHLGLRGRQCRHRHRHRHRHRYQRQARPAKQPQAGCKPIRTCPCAAVDRAAMRATALTSVVAVMAPSRGASPWAWAGCTRRCMPTENTTR